MDSLESRFQEEFLAAPEQPWHTPDGSVLAGLVRTAGGTSGSAGNYTFVRVFEAGFVLLSSGTVGITISYLSPSVTWYLTTSPKQL